MNGCFVGWAVLFACVSIGLAEGRETQHVYPDNCNVVWDTPSTDSLGSMPLGNGDIGLNVWTEPETGALLFYISKVDAFDDKGITFKLGKVRLALTPNPFSVGRRFRQELVLKDGAIEIKTGSGAEEVSLRVWVDANQSLIRVQGESATPMDVAVTWEGLRNPMRGFPDAGTVDGGPALPKGGTTGMKLDDQADRLVWAYRNETSVWKQKLIAQKSATLAETAHDPLLKLTSGCLVNGNGFVRDGKKDALRLKEKSRAFELAVHVLTCQTETASAWFSRIGAQAESADKAKAFDEHRKWWRAFWNRSYIAVEKCGGGPVQFDGYRFSGYDEPFGDYCKGLSVDSRAHAFQLTQRYALERFLQACASRGSVPPPFNGSIFTMDLPAGVHSFGKPRARSAGANTRDWGTLPFFWQNTRHPGWSMLARGDFDAMLPSFRLIAASLEVAKDRARQWFGHEGAFMPEGILAGGVAIFDKAPGHLTYHWLGTIEMTAMMCDYFEHTQDEKFLKETLLPCADEFVKFYELHYPKRDARGKMVMEPAGTVETYQPVTNPVTEVSGLRYLLGKLLSLDEALVGAERKAYWTRVSALLPDVPWRTVKGLELLAPGEKYAGRLICETPELYAVWPFRQAALGGDTTLLARARRSFHVRQLSLDGTPDSQSWETGGWQPAPIWAACLGLPREAARLVSINFDDRFPNIADNSAMVPPVPGHPRARFPGFWETKMDYTPDNDHGAVSANALQSLLLQSDPPSPGSSGATGGGRIYLLPAWPEDWDVSFTLHAPFNTTVTCVYRNGKVQSLKVTPEARRADIVDYSLFENRIRTLVSVACADVNWLFGLPPMLDGLPEPGPMTGPWLEEYGESVKEVRGTPWPLCTFKDKTLYVFGLDGKEPVIPKMAATQLSVKRLSGKQATPVAILKVEYDQPLEEVVRALTTAGSLTEGKKASADGVLDLGQTSTFDRIELTIENPGHRRGSPKTFAVDVLQADGTWKSVYRGSVYGTLFSKRIEPVQARQVRVTCAAPVRRFDLFQMVIVGGGLAHAGLRLDSCFGDNMVLQRDKPCPVRGWADQGAEVTVEFAGQKKTATATGTNGIWRVMLDPMPACAVPGKMKITSTLNPDSYSSSSAGGVSAKVDPLTLSNILVGDVWVCSGQSNMRQTVMKGPWCGYGGVMNASNEVAAADYPGIRLFQNFGATNWSVCAPDSAKMFSAAGYFFARELHRQLKIPIGIAEGSMGATDAESWAPREALFAAAEIQAAEKVYLELKPLADEDRKAGGDWKRAYDQAKKEGKPLPRQPAAKLSRDDSKRYGDAARIHYAGNNYSGFIAKYTAMSIKGVIWYQGESNRPRADQYAALMTRLIASWRKAWGQEFPFLVMQLVNFGQGPGKPQTAFSELRQAQQEIADTVPNTGLAVGVDIGVPDQIHPPNKQEVGGRLALVALQKAYGQDVVACGPVLKSAKFDAGKAVLSFDPGGKLQKLVLKNSATNGFELAGADGLYVPVSAVVEGNEIILTAPGIGQPQSVRYAWYDDPPVSLFNSDGLPAAPFKKNR